MNDLTAHFRPSQPAGIASQDQTADAADAAAFGRLLDEIHTDWSRLAERLRDAGGQLADHPGARRLMVEHADLLRRARLGYLARLRHEIATVIRHG